ncbi:hypothetical protein [Clostridium estertheticum]|nr:hypothetical protein [Clostridium estertheticum]
MGLKTINKNKVYNLSGGEQQRVAIDRALEFRLSCFRSYI